MLEICATCPNSLRCPTGESVPVGGAILLVDESGLYVYATNKVVDGAWTLSQGEINDRDGTTFPELTEAFKQCKAPVMRDIEIPMRGIWNLLRGKTESVPVEGICPALGSVLDTRTAKTVEAYFNKDPRV